MSNESSQASRKALTNLRRGRVVSDKRDKTRTVAIEYLAKLPKIGKYVRQRSMSHVHDEQNASRRGDLVEIAPCRPLSKTKSWRLVRIVHQAPREGKATAAGAASTGGGAEAGTAPAGGGEGQ